MTLAFRRKSALDRSDATLRRRCPTSHPLELDCLIDFGGHGTWLKVPLGKLGTERMVPLDGDALTALDG